MLNTGIICAADGGTEGDAPSTDGAKPWNCCSICFTGMLMAQHHYCQIQKEVLAVILGLKKFHQFFNGRSFILVSNHKQLNEFFSPTREYLHKQQNDLFD